MPSTPALVLGSASPARLDTLRRAGVSPYVLVSHLDEERLVARARATYGDIAPDDVALVLELDGEVHGKPSDAVEAVARWQRMRGRSGVLHTGHWIIDERDEEEGGTGATLGAVASTTVHFAKVSDEEIEAYVATGEPLRVAGAFTLDGLGAPFVSGIEGDPSNVVGVSVPLVRELLGEMGVPWFAMAGAPAAS